MSLRYLSKTSGFLVSLVLALGMSGHAYAETVPVQIYTDQAAPAAPPASEAFPNAPIPAGSLTLEDVLKAHEPKKPRDVSSAPSATGTMLSVGMSSVLQKYSLPPTEVGAPVESTPATSPKTQPQTGQTQAPPPVADASAKPTGIAYEPGQAPKNLGLAQTAPTDLSIPVAPNPGAAPTAPAASSPPATPQGCSEKVQKWEKNCGEAGYPSKFVGKISGETRTGCSDNSLHDVWVTNTCAPPGATTPAQSAKTESASAPIAAPPAKTTKAESPSCGSSNGVVTDTAPSDNLCSSGTASEIHGNGPWTWTCSGADKTEACVASITENKQAEQQSDGDSSSEAPAPQLAPESSKTDAVQRQNSDDASPPPPLAARVAALAKAAAALASGSSASPAPPAPQAPPADTSNASDDLCGEAAETMAYKAPEKNLCRKGSPSMVTGDGPWTWSCTNNEGAVSSCRTLSLKGESSTAPKPAPAPTPEAAPSSPPAETPHMLQAPSKAASSDSPSPPEPPAKPKPACGSADGQPAVTAPASGLCEEGKASAVRGVNPWRWTCGKGKAKVSCTTIKATDGACGTSNGIPAASAPTINLCKSGTPSPVGGAGPWTWTCSSDNGGNSASCITPVAAIAAEPPPAEKTSAVPTPTESFAAPPAPSPIPEAASVKGDAAPQSAPALSKDSTPVQPPALRDTLPSAPVLQKSDEGQPAQARSAPFALDPTLSTILFAHDSETIDPSVHITLDKLAAALQQNPDTRISLLSYADNAGQKATPAAHRLSLARALAVRAYLSSKDISESRIDIHAEGATAPSGYPDRVDVKVND